MGQTLEIVEILERSTRGITRPFLCRCEDDRLYYVKGKSAGPRSLICEWLAGHLARAFKLPVPEFSIVQVAPALLNLQPMYQELGTRPAFGSLRVDNAQELTVAHASSVDPDLQMDVVVFDWWVRNLDRSLTAAGGNPNLLWSSDSEKLTTFDHNLAFDRDFDVATFRSFHVFGRWLAYVCGDAGLRSRYAARMNAALADWPLAWETMPEDWLWADEEKTETADFDPVAALLLLNRCRTEEIWDLSP